jgi:hypothetical protein
VEQLLADLAALKPDHITPLEALNCLIAWKRRFAPSGAPKKAQAAKAPVPKKTKAPEKGAPWLFDE